MRFRDSLAAEFERRKDAGGRYSVRRFALRLGVHHATLLRLLRGSRPVTSRTVRRLGFRLGLSSVEIERLAAREDRESVLAVVRRRTFRPDARWIAAAAGIPVDRVNIALQHLLRTGRLQMTARDVWMVKEENR